MCEPAHSIVQYPEDFDDSGLPFGDYIDKETRLARALGPVYRLGKKIKGYFHFSMFGGGHSIATMEHAKNTIYLPAASLWEGKWWIRRLDSDSFRASIATCEAEDAAREYFDRCVNGNIHLFRRFIETSMRNTRLNDPALYVRHLANFVLTPETGDKLYNKCVRLFGCTLTERRLYCIGKEQVIRMVMGFLRKRENFCDQFADDSKFWKHPIEGVQG